MSTNSNQGPPDLDVVFRELLSFLFKTRDRRNRKQREREQPERNQRKVVQEQNSFKRLIEKQTKKRLENKQRPEQATTAKNNDRRTQEHMQRQRIETKAVSKPRADVASSKTENTITQQVTAYQRSRLRPTAPIKADKVVEKNINANSTYKWLHDPRALRQAFVLKELLEPPIALRKRDRRRFS